MSDPVADAPPPPIPVDRLQAALSLLEPHGAHPQTGPLHDPLYELLRGGGASEVDTLRRALLRCADHPAAPALRRLLEADLGLERDTVEQVLTRFGPWRHDHVADEVAERLQRAGDLRRAMEQQATAQAEQIARLSRTVDALSLVGAVLAVLALVGWLGAMDVWTVDWMTPPQPPPEGTPQEQKP
ncbi:hypothetical protein L6R53_14765 [Myxococcota bacterium]|nr:hypothetical protein [Myxococcota bacterium]